MNNSASADKPKKTVNTGNEGRTAVNVRFIEPEGRCLKTPERRSGSLPLDSDSVIRRMSPIYQRQTHIDGERVKGIDAISVPSDEEIEKAKRGDSTDPILCKYASLSGSRANFLMSINKPTGLVVVKNQEVADALFGEDAKKKNYVVVECCPNNTDFARIRKSFQDLLEHKGSVIEIEDVM